jgi:tetratricopeptide (TPR) repeat protein
MGDDGRSYAVTVYYIKIYPLGTEVNPDTVGSLGGNGYFSDTFNATRTGDGLSLGQDATDNVLALDKVLSSIRFAWGLASYRKGDYDAALFILPRLGYSNSEYYASTAAYQKGMHVRGSRQLDDDAIAHVERAISMHMAEDPVKAAYYYQLGVIHFGKLVTRETQELKQEAGEAVRAFHKAAEIYKASDLRRAASYSELREAQSLYELYGVLSDNRAGKQDLAHAEGAVVEALANLGGDTAEYFEAKSFLFTKRRQATNSVRFPRNIIRIQ